MRRNGFVFLAVFVAILLPQPAEAFFGSILEEVAEFLNDAVDVFGSVLTEVLAVVLDDREMAEMISSTIMDMTPLATIADLTTATAAAVQCAEQNSDLSNCAEEVGEALLAAVASVPGIGRYGKALQSATSKPGERNILTMVKDTLSKNTDLTFVNSKDFCKSVTNNAPECDTDVTVLRRGAVQDRDETFVSVSLPKGVSVVDGSYKVGVDGSDNDVFLEVKSATSKNDGDYIYESAVNELQSCISSSRETETTMRRRREAGLHLIESTQPDLEKYRRSVCSSSADCSSGSYCDYTNSCYDCLYCEYYNDEIDGLPCTESSVCGSSSGCSAHTECPEGLYCDSYNDCYDCASCFTYNDAIDGTCPEKCSVFEQAFETSLWWTDFNFFSSSECSSSSTCGDGNYCDSFGSCYSCDVCEIYQDAIEFPTSGGCPESCGPTNSTTIAPWKFKCLGQAIAKYKSEGGQNTTQVTQQLITVMEASESSSAHLAESSFFLLIATIGFVFAFWNNCEANF